MRSRIRTLTGLILLATLAASDPAQDQEALKFGMPDTGHIIDYGRHVISYDGRLRSARWVAEKLTEESLKKNVKRKDSFRPDRRIPSEFRAELSDYRRSGFDRGHLAPSGNHLLSREVNSATFFLTNMSPQVGSGFNRGYWKRLEESIRERAKREAVRELYVFTGPLFMPDNAPRQGRETGVLDDGDDESDEDSHAEPLRVTYRYIGGNHIPVPTHYFKAILVVPSDSGHSVKLYTFILPNRAIDSDTDLKTFARSVDYLEHWAGFDLWSELEDEVEDFKEDTAWGNWGALGGE